MSWIEWAATLLGIAYVVLMIRRNILCWVAGNLGVALQAISFYRVRLYADLALQLVYFAMGCYGLVQWLRGTAQRHTRDVKRVPWQRLWLLLTVVWLVGSAAWGYVLRTWTNAALPELDATLATASLIATWMQAHRYLDNWLLWIAIDAAYAAVYWSRGLYLYTGLYAVFVVLAWRGWNEWKALAR